MLNPLPASRWNYATAAHLYNRAGFGGTPSEIESLLKLGPDDAVSFFVDYDKIPADDTRPDWAKPDPERNERLRQVQQMAREEKDSSGTEDEKREAAEKRQEKVREIQREQYRHLEEMRGEWLKRMATGLRPFQEKLTLFWHGHFATSAVKVRDAYFMWLQIDTFRNLAEGNWLDLLEAVAKDPAMLVWLDGAQSRKEHPNENFARECMELFALGEGHYTEKDVTEAARAMTGWSLDRINEEYRYRPFTHDNGIKTVLGRTGNLTGRDVLETIVAQPQAAQFIASKLWKFFGSDDPSPELMEALAETFRANDNNFKPLLRIMFRSEEFYSVSVMRTQIKSPVQWLVESIRLLERPMPPPIVSTEMIKSLGQDLLMPPNVKGWDGGLSWITTNTLLARYNQAAILIMGQGNLGAPGGGRPGEKMAAQFANAAARRMAPSDVDKIVTDADRQDPEKLIVSLGKRFLQGQLTDKHRQILRDYLAPKSELDDHDVRTAIRLLMSTPEYQIT
ncbi:MAG TPA: DUF1800 domain-containing protein [Verrucomicrobiae bacterium]